MPKFLVHVSENIEHLYEIEADSAEEAENIYYSYNDDELTTNDLDGNHSWDSPWEIEEVKE